MIKDKLLMHYKFLDIIHGTTHFNSFKYNCKTNCILKGLFSCQVLKNTEKQKLRDISAKNADV